jgi:aspartate 1-decarboxylase
MIHSRSYFLINGSTVVPAMVTAIRHVININNGERLDTYTIPGPAGSGSITLNGPAARKVQTGDLIIILAYCHVDATEAASHTPILVFPDEQTNLLK